jgi:hypothetical protein
MTFVVNSNFIIANVVIGMALVIARAIAQTTTGAEATIPTEGSGRPPATSTRSPGADCDPSIATGFENCTSVAYECVQVDIVEGGSVCHCFGALQSCLERNEQLKQCSTFNDITAGWTELCFVHECRGCGTRSTLVGLCRSSVSDELDRCEDNAQQCIGTDKVAVCQCAETFFRCATGDGRAKTCSRFEKLNATYTSICANNGCSAAQCAEASVCTESALSALKACFAAAQLTENACADPCSCARDVDSCLAADGAVACESAVAQPNNLHRCDRCRSRDSETVSACIADETACLARSLDVTAAVCACRRDFNECVGSARSCATVWQDDMITANGEQCELLRCSVCGESAQTSASLIVLGALALMSQLWQ